MTRATQEAEEVVDWTEIARHRLVRVLGEQKAAPLVKEILGELGLPTLHSVADLAAFGDALAHRGGFLAAVGVSLKTHAMLRGFTPRS